MTDLKGFIRDVPDFPRKGIVFKDITPLHQDPGALAAAVERMAGTVEPPDVVVAIESRGFVFGAGLALRWRVPLVLARKFGKLPGRTVREVYALEYGEDTLEMHADSIAPGRRVVVVDDLLATGGTALATVRMVEKLKGRVEGLVFLIELKGLGGRKRLEGYPVKALIESTVVE